MLACRPQKLMQRDVDRSKVTRKVEQKEKDAMEIRKSVRDEIVTQGSLDLVLTLLVVLLQISHMQLEMQKQAAEAAHSAVPAQ